MPTETLPRLTERQRQVLDFYLDYATEHGEWPTVRQAMAAIGISSPNGMKCHLAALVKKGYAAHTPMVSRGTRVVRDADGRDVRIGLVREGGVA